MKHITICLIFLLCINMSTVRADSDANTSENCMNKAMTQGAMNDCALQGFKEIQSELDVYLAKIREGAANNPEFLEKLDKAQRTWEEFKKAQIDLLYFGHGGSVAPMCRSLAAARLTYLRLEQFKEWSQYETGDICSWWYEREPGEEQE